MLSPEALPALRRALQDTDSGVRYWAALGLLMRGKAAVDGAYADLRQALDDPSPYVRIIAAEALGQNGDDRDFQRVLPLLAAHADGSQGDVFVSIAALAALDALGDKAAPVAAQINALSETRDVPDARYGNYLPRLLEDLRARFR